jgi:hypothetical protein
MRPAIYVFIILLYIIMTSGCVSQEGTYTDVDVDKPIETPIVTQPPPQEEVIEAPIEPTPAPIIEEPPPVEHVNIDYAANLNEKYQTCLKCHGDVKGFHTTEAISIIDERKGISPRLCIVCHGQTVHTIHWEILKSEYIICDTCHGYKEEFVVPEAREGQLLVCELCHSGGNYIKIHIEGTILDGAPIDVKWMKEGSSHQCDTCHVGELETVHFEALSTWREGVDSAAEEADANPPSPLNISYT